MSTANPTATHPGHAARVAIAQRAKLSALRISGVLTQDAQLYPTAGGSALLVLHLQPGTGLAYDARITLGTDVADHMAAQAELPRLRRGVMVSVAGDALELRTDHGHAVLRVVNARDAVAFFDHPATAPATTPPLEN